MRDHLFDLIRKQVYAPGQRLPSERELARTLSISRLTLRVALNELADEGVVQSSVGRGWFVSRTVSEPPGALMSFTRMVRAAGLTPSNRVIHAGLRPATEAEGRALEWAVSRKLVDITRVRLIDGEPAAVDHSRLRVRDGQGLLRENLVDRSLYDLVEARGTVPTSADFTISARVADERLAALLEVAEGTPLLALDQVTRDQTGRVFELVEEIYRVDRYRFRGVFHRDGTLTSSASPEVLDRSGDSPA